MLSEVTTSSAVSDAGQPSVWEVRGQTRHVCDRSASSSVALAYTEASLMFSGMPAASPDSLLTSEDRAFEEEDGAWSIISTAAAATARSG